MATRSTIGIKNSDGSVEAVYCHWDGYLEHVGKILSEHYNTEEKIRDLLSYGDISSLEKTTTDSVFYMRDRKEKDQISFTLTAEEVKTKLIKHQQEFNYLWEDGRWTYSEWNEMNFRPF